MTARKRVPPPPSADDACPLCGYWRCRCEEVLRTTTHTTG